MQRDVNWPVPGSIIDQLPRPQLASQLEPKDASVPFSGSRSAVEWLKYVVAVHQQDKMAESKRKRVTVWAALALPFGAVTFVIGASVDSNNAVAFAISALAVLSGILLLVRRSQLETQDIDDSRLEAFSGTVLALAPELKTRKPLAGRVDFTAFTNHLVPSTTDGEVYRQRWLQLNLPAKDGCQINLSVTLSVKQKSKAKRRYTKIKQRRVESVRVRITPPPGVRAVGFANANAYRGRAVSWLVLREVSIQPHSATFHWSSPPMLVGYSRSGWAAQTPLYSIGSKELVSVLAVSHRLAAGGGRHAQ